MIVLKAKLRTFWQIEQHRISPCRNANLNELKRFRMGQIDSCADENNQKIKALETKLQTPADTSNREAARNIHIEIPKLNYAIYLFGLAK